MLIKRLQDHAFGKRELSPTQVRVIEILLRKLLPDLKAVKSTGETNHRVNISWKQETLRDSEAAKSRR